MLGFDSYPGANNYTVQKAMFDAYHNLGNGTKIVAMTENGPIPDLGQAIAFDARWSWFCSWNDMVTAENTTQHIIDMFNHAYALTVENCPSYQNASVATPVFNPPSGTYTAPQSVAISTATTGATIYYTTNGSTPTTSSLVYSSPINITSTTTIRAIATKSGLDNSSVGSATYTINGPEFLVGAIYRVTARHSNKVMEVAGSSLANGALIQQNSSASTDNQKWKFVDGGSGTFKFVAVHSGKALEVNGSSATEGASIVQWDLLSNQSQRWNVVSVGGGYYKIENVNSGKVLGVESARRTNGTLVKQYTYTGATNQQWKIELISAPAGRTANVVNSSEESVDPNGEISVYPNPAEGKVNIDLTQFRNSNVNIALQDLSGKTLQSSWTTGGGICVIPTTGLQKGHYLIRLRGNGKLFYKKLVIK
jgi:glucosylceramidase